MAATAQAWQCRDSLVDASVCPACQPGSVVVTSWLCPWSWAPQESDVSRWAPPWWWCGCMARCHPAAACQMQAASRHRHRAISRAVTTR